MGTQGAETEEACESAKQKFDSCNDQARAKFSGFGCSSTCDFVTSLASCLADLTSTCPVASAHLLRWEEGREAREASAREVTARATTTTWSQSMCQMLC